MLGIPIVEAAFPMVTTGVPIISFLHILIAPGGVADPYGLIPGIPIGFTIVVQVFLQLQVRQCRLS